MFHSNFRAGLSTFSNLVVLYRCSCQVNYTPPFYCIFSHLSIPVPAFLSFFRFSCCWVLRVYPSFGTIPFSHSPGSQLPGPQRVDQQAGVIETSPRGQQCCSYILVLGFFQNTISLYLPETNTVHTATTAVLESAAAAQASTTTINISILLLLLVLLQLVCHYNY